MLKTGFASVILALAICIWVGCKKEGRTEPKSGAPISRVEEGVMATFQLTSPAFRHGDTIPVKFTCDGEDVSPELNWTGVPSGTKAFALICDDPDAPMGTWAHWVLFNLPPELNSLPENFTASKAERHGAERPGFFVNGINDFRRLGYGGPCPPKGPTHRYFFKLYALDQPLGLKSGASKADVEQAMKGHVLAMAELMGKYKR